jgi:hypothetical protein
MQVDDDASDSADECSGARGFGKHSDDDLSEHGGNVNAQLAKELGSLRLANTVRYGRAPPLNVEPEDSDEEEY